MAFFFCDEWLSSDEVLKTFAAVQRRQASAPVRMALAVLLFSRSYFCAN